MCCKEHLNEITNQDRIDSSVAIARALLLCKDKAVRGMTVKDRHDSHGVLKVI